MLVHLLYHVSPILLQIISNEIKSDLTPASLPLHHFKCLQLLSASIRNRVYEGIATILASSQVRGSRLGDRETERCLFWVLALFRNVDLEVEEGNSHSGPQRDQSFLGGTLHGHTKRDLREALELVSQEKSKKGLLAALLLHYF